MHIFSEQKGVALIFSILLVGFMLSIALTLAAIFIPKIRTSGDVRRSSGALYSAESIVEWCVYTNRHPVPANDPVPTPAMSNGASYCINKDGVCTAIDASDCSIDSGTVNITGTYQGVNRTYQVTF